MFFRNKNYSKKSSAGSLIFIVLMLACLIYFFIQFNNNVLPSAYAISEKYATAEINRCINASAEKAVADLALTEEDLFTHSGTAININTLLINRLCGSVSTYLSDSLTHLSEEKIELPVGMLSGSELFSNLGPRFNIRLVPLGSTDVDYETDFKAVGINQINFHIWLNIRTEISIVNPLYTKNVVINRKLMLVNTVYSGDVPSTYFDMRNDNSSFKENLFKD